MVDIGEFSEFAEQLKDKRTLAQLSVFVAAEQSGVRPEDYLKSRTREKTTCQRSRETGEVVGRSRRVQSDGVD